VFFIVQYKGLPKRYNEAELLRLLANQVC